MSPRSALERYLDHLRHERRLSAHTVSAYARDGRTLERLCAGRDFGALTPHDIRRFVATLHGRGQSPRSLARILSSWRGLYEWLARKREKHVPVAGIGGDRMRREPPFVAKVREVALERASRRRHGRAS